MESRQERHGRSNKEPKPSKKPSLKFVVGYSIAAVACIAVGIGASYWTSNSNNAEEDDALPKPIAVVSPLPTLSTAGGVSPKVTSTVSPKPTSVPSVSPSTSPQGNVAIGKQESSGSQVKLSFVGDVIMASKVEDILKQKGYDYPYSNVKDFLTKPDFTIANLETPITTRGVIQSKEYTYRSSPLALPAFKEAGFDIVNMANNHILDYGTDGLLDTFDALDQAGIKHVGAGKDSNAAYQPVIVEKDGMKIAVFGFSRVVPETSWKAGINHPGVAETYDYKLPVEAIQKAKASADLVVVVAHWGVERDDNPDKYQKELAHRYIDAGADLIVGGHPHVLQGFEQYKGKWIAYSLGNFIFTTNDTPKTWETVIMEASCSKDKSCDIHLVPIMTKLALPTPMSTEDGAMLFQRLSKISIGAGVDAQGNVSKK